MNQFLFDTHVHTSEVSPCGGQCAREVARNYKRIGYNGIIITDHMHPRALRRAKSDSWEAKAAYFLDGWRLAHEEETPDFSVLLAMEIRFLDSDNDYLLFGFDEAFVQNTPDLDSFPSLEAFRPVADANGLLIFQAHPFRHEMMIADYHMLDGMEVYNGNSSHNSSNDAAAFWAEKYKLRPLSGSDYHGTQCVAYGGVYFPEQIRTNAQLLTALREGQYTLK